jgi:hypothetical protein
LTTTRRWKRPWPSPRSVSTVNACCLLRCRRACRCARDAMEAAPYLRVQARAVQTDYVQDRARGGVLEPRRLHDPCGVSIFGLCRVVCLGGGGSRRQCRPWRQPVLRKGGSRPHKCATPMRPWPGCGATICGCLCEDSALTGWRCGMCSKQAAEPGYPGSSDEAQGGAQAHGVPPCDGGKLFYPTLNSHSPCHAAQGSCHAALPDSAPSCCWVPRAPARSQRRLLDSYSRVCRTRGTTTT